MRAIKGYQRRADCAHGATANPLLYQRPGNLRMMEWAELIWIRRCDYPQPENETHGAGEEQGEAIPCRYTQAVALLRSIHPLTDTGASFLPVSAAMTGHCRIILCAVLVFAGFGKEQSWHGSGQARTCWLTN